jgi:hypothetical protein
MSKNVKVVKVETVKGGKADRIVLHYVGSDGSTWKIGALAAKLDESSRKTLLAAKEGDTLSVSIAKEGNYWNLMSAGPAQASEAPQGKTYNKSNTYSKSSYQTPQVGRLTDLEKAAGQQRGNVLSNAVAIVVAAGVKDVNSALKQVEKTAIELLGISNNLEVASNASTSTEVDLSSDDSVVDELGF